MRSLKANFRLEKHLISFPNLSGNWQSEKMCYIIKAMRTSSFNFGGLLSIRFILSSDPTGRP